MFRVIKMSSKYYAMEIVEDFEDLTKNDEEIENLQVFVNQGEPVIFCNNLEDLDGLLSGLDREDPDTFEIVE